MPATAPWLASAEAMLNRSIAGSSPAQELARRLNSTSLQIEIDGFVCVRAAMLGGRLALLTARQAQPEAPGAQPNAAPGATPGEAPPDAVISGSPAALLSLLKGGTRPAAAPERPAVTVRGDAEIANLYRQLFLAARPDPEEELSRWIGDAPARAVSRLAGGILAWAARARRTLGENVAEYLTEESRDLVARTEVDEFMHGVDEVRESADRIEARLREAQRRLMDGG